MTNEEVIVVLQKIKPIPHRGDSKSTTHILETIALDMAIKALEQQPCEDCISRQAVDEYITNLLSGYLYDEERTRLEDLTAFIWELPPVTPQPKIGHWMECGGDEPWLKGYCCSLCNFTTTQKYDYCICGAKMVESEEV